jgi:outer membrane protein assembly factor BamB
VSVISSKVSTLQQKSDLLEQARSAVRSDPDWDLLRRRICPEAIHLTDRVVFDFRRLLTQARWAAMAGRLMWKLIRPLSPEVLIGPGYGASPLLYAIAAEAFKDECRLEVLLVKDNRSKTKSSERWILGRHDKARKRTVIVDDFMETGSALEVIERALKEDAVELNLHAFSVFFDMWQPLGSRQISLAKLPVLSLYRRHDIGLSRDAYDAKPPLMKGNHADFIDQPLWWRFGLNENNKHPRKSSPVIADNAVFVADDSSTVWRHNAENGDIEWSYESLSRPVKGIVQQLQYADGSLVFGCYDGTITRLDAKTGCVIWRWREDSSVHATPEIDLVNQRLFISTEQWNDGEPFGHLYAMDWNSGKLIWSYEHAWWAPGSPAYDAKTNIVVASCNDQTIVAVDASTGRIVWKISTQGLVRGKPGIGGDRVIVSTEEGYLIAFDIRTGSEIWKCRYGVGNQHQFVHICDDVVIALDGRWHVVAFDIASGEVRWMSRLRSAGTWCPISFGRYFLVLSNEGHLALFDSGSEKKLWEGSIGGTYKQPPAIGSSSKGSIFAASSNNEGLKVFRIHSDYAGKVFA